jgi:hypothetical protein
VPPAGHTPANDAAAIAQADVQADVKTGFGLRGEPQLAADVRRGGGAGALTLLDPCFELAVQTAEDVGFVADLQGGEDSLAHGFEFGLVAIRIG